MTASSSGSAGDAGPQRGEDAAASSLCAVSTTRCPARTRLYRDGSLELEGFPVADISDYLADESTTIWLDLEKPSPADLAVISEEFGLHPLAIEDAVHHHQRPKLDRYRSHLFLTAYGAHLAPGTGLLATSELAAFLTGRALITVRKDDGLDIGAVVQRWDDNPDLARFGVGYLLHGVLDYIVDAHFEAVQSLDDLVEALEDQLFDNLAPPLVLHQRIFELRKSLVMLRRVVIPMREVVNAVMRHDLNIVADDMMPYYHDVYDHVLRAADWSDSLRDLVTSMLETNLTIQSNRMNIVIKKVTGWAAIVAVPTFITGYFGMNVPYPGFSNETGFALSVAAMVVAAAGLYVIFRRNDWI